MAAVRWRRLRRDLTGYLFLAPFLVPFGLFFVYPFFEGLYLSLTNQNLVTGAADFVGLRNYQLLLQDETFQQSFVNTCVFVVTNSPLLVFSALAGALLLNEALLARSLVRAAFVAPYLITSAAAAIIWQYILNPQGGLLNLLLQTVGLSPQAWLSTPGQAMGAVVLVTLWWRVGFPLLVLLAGLQEIPGELYEAARIDGAGRLATFRYITLPLLLPVLAFVTIIRLIDSFKVFAQVYLVTGGGPYGTTRVVIQYLYETAFQYYKIGYAAAIGWTLFLVVLLVTLVQLKLFRQVGQSLER